MVDTPNLGSWNDHWINITHIKFWVHFQRNPYGYGSKPAALHQKTCWLMDIYSPEHGNNILPMEGDIPCTRICLFISSNFQKKYMFKWWLPYMEVPNSWMAYHGKSMKLQSINGWWLGHPHDWGNLRIAFLIKKSNTSQINPQTTMLFGMVTIKILYVINHPPVITIFMWYKPININHSQIAGLWHCFTHIPKHQPPSSTCA